MMTRPDTGVSVHFEDRWTLAYERTYPHPIERVFRAVSEEEHLSAWMLGPHRVDHREGGRFTFTLGGVESPGIITRLEAPSVVEFTFFGLPPTRLRFELVAIDADTTNLTMFHHWGPLPDSDLPGFTRGASDGWELLLAFELPNHLEGKPPLRTKDVGIDLGPHYDRLLADEMPPPPAHSPLATFDDRSTMRHVRRYDHPIERVWAAVTEPSQMETWMLPHITVEPRAGGRATFTWGGPADQPVEHKILVWDPPRVVDYGGLRFELESLADGSTQLTFVQSFPPGFRHPHPAPEGDPGGDLPGGPDTPWRPGFVAGFHLMFDALTRFLAGELEPKEGWLDDQTPNSVGVYPPDWVWLCHVYREHIRATIPPAG